MADSTVDFPILEVTAAAAAAGSTVVLAIGSEEREEKQEAALCKGFRILRKSCRDYD